MDGWVVRDLRYLGLLLPVPAVLKGDNKTIKK